MEDIMEAEAMVTEAMVEDMEDMEEVMEDITVEAMVTEAEDMGDIMGDTESISVRIC